MILLRYISSQRDIQLEVQKLRNMVNVLDKELQSKKAKINQLEESIKQNASKETSFLSKIEDLLKQNEALRNKISSIHTQATKYQESSKKYEKEAEECKTQLNEKINQIRVLDNQLKFGSSSELNTSDQTKCNCENGDSHSDNDKFIDPRWEFGQYIYKQDLYNKEYVYDEQTEAENGPKDITLYCPVNPQLKITDLPLDLIDKDICLQLQIGSPDIKSRLVIFCNGDIQRSS